MLRTIRLATFDSASAIGRSERSSSLRLDHRDIDLADRGGPSGRDPYVDERGLDPDAVAGVDLDRGTPALLDDHLAMGAAPAAGGGGTQERQAQEDVPSVRFHGTFDSDCVT